MTPQEALQQLVAAYPDWRWSVQTKHSSEFGVDYCIFGRLPGSDKFNAYVSFAADLDAAVTEALRQARLANWDPYKVEAA